jgi:hypothetical protein
MRKEHAMRVITTRQELTDLARELGVRSDWHEPDEQGLTARVEGFTFDNAGFWPTINAPGTWRTDTRGVELHVILSHTTEAFNDSKDVAAVNLATLLAWACGTAE